MTTIPIPQDQCEHGYQHGRGCPDCPRPLVRWAAEVTAMEAVSEFAEAVGVPTGALVSVRRQLADSYEAVYWQDCQRWRAMLSRDASGILFMAGAAEAIGAHA